MIKDNISNINKYNGLNELIKEGLKYLSEIDFSKMSDGKYQLKGEKMFVNIQTYMTKPDAYYEAHKKYIDIQYIISGAEYIAVTKRSECSPYTEYDEDNDIEFLEGQGEYIELNQGEFMILYPDDAHKPSISINAPENVRKAVVKVIVE